MTIELSDIVGQDSVVGRLQKLLSGGRMPHALLFAGPAGVGRRTTATALAKTLLCGKPVEFRAGSRPAAPAGGLLMGLPEEPAADPSAPLYRQACGQCDDCRMFEAGSHGDFHLIYKELARFHEDSSVRGRVMQELGIEIIRTFLIAAAARAPSRGRGKVFVVKEAELMSAAAQNALLKTLEEPPPGVRIILLAEQPEQLLPTTLSRCAMIRFGLLPVDFVTAGLTDAQIAPDEARFWAAFTDGSIGRALRLAQAGLYEIKRHIVGQLASLSRAGDAELGEELAKITDKLATEAVSRAKKADGADLAKTLASRQAAGAMLELIASAYRDAMTLATGAQRPLVHADQPGEIDAISRRMEPARLASVIEHLSEFEQLLWRNVNPKIVWDNVVVSCASGARLAL